MAGPDHAPAAGLVTDLSGVRAGYDHWAALYDREANPVQALEGPLVRQALGEVAGLAALDLGCGTGRHALWLAQQGATVTALDFSPAMLAVARAKHRSEQGLAAGAVRWLEHDLHQPLPVADGSFDLVVSGLVLEHLRDLPAFFAEARRVLLPGGRAVISTMHPAMFRRGAQARFTDPATGELVRPGSLDHPLAAIRGAALAAGFAIAELVERAPDEGFAQRYPRAGRYLGCPMVLVLRLSA